MEDFERLLDENPEIEHVELSNYGEMFLNPRLPELLEAAYRRNVVVSGSNGVNLNFAREDALEAVVRYRVRGLTCSIDGATADSYARYRRNGNLNQVLRNIDRILHYKRELRSGFPLLYWQFVVFGHNEDEVETARRMAEERGMEFVPRLSWDSQYAPVANPELVTIQTGLTGSTREEFKAKTGVDYTRDICYQLWRAPVVNWDGKLLGCCVNYWGDFGANVFADGLAGSVASPRMEQARGMLLGKQSPSPEIPCSTCSQFESLRESGRWLTDAEVASHSGPSHLVSVVPLAPESIRFAKVAISQVGDAALEPAATDSTGRGFRFGIDHAFFSTVPGPGSYQAIIEALTPSGWRRFSRSFTVLPRPICHEFVFDLRTPQDVSEDSKVANSPRLKTWIR